MDAVDRREVTLLAPARHAFVGEQHQFFDELIGALDPNVLGAAKDIDRFTRLLVQNDLGLGKLEIERATLHAKDTQSARQLVRHTQPLDHRIRRRLVFGFARQSERARPPAVRQLRLGPHYASNDTARSAQAPAAELHFDAKADAINARPTRTEIPL